MKPRMRQQARFSALYVLVAVVVLIGLQSWLVTPRPQELPLSRLLQLVREDRVARVSFSETEIRGVLKQPLPGSPVAPDWLTRLTGTQPDSSSTPCVSRAPTMPSCSASWKPTRSSSPGGSTRRWCGTWCSAGSSPSAS